MGVGVINDVDPQLTVSSRMFVSEDLPSLIALLMLCCWSTDGCDVCYGALELGRQAVDNCNSTRLEDILLKDTCLHKWPYLTSKLTQLCGNSQFYTDCTNSVIMLLCYIQVYYSRA